MAGHGGVAAGGFARPQDASGRLIARRLARPPPAGRRLGSAPGRQARSRRM